MRVEPYAVALRAPLGTAHGAITERRGFVVRVDADGHEGVGEASPLPDWTENVHACERALSRAADAIADGDVMARSSQTDALDATDDAPAARHGVSLAFLDAEAKRAGRPLYRHLGADAPVERVPVNATVGDANAETTAERVGEAVAAGFETVKVKVGARSLDADLARLRAVRAAAPDVAVRVDANAAWDRETAARAFDALADLAVEYVEQPLSADDLGGHAALRGGAVGVALDESVAAHGVEDVLDAGAADAAVLKPMALGGPDRTVDAGRRAREAGVEPVVTTTFDAVYARTAAVHAAAALAPLPACGLATASALDGDLAPDPARVVGGAVAVPQGKGNGVSTANGE